MTRRFGFTLAEVLITLGIIGVVAAMTIPTLMNSTGQAEFKTGYKKIISTLNQAITMNVALDSTDFSNLTAGTASGGTMGMFMSRMNLVKTSAAADTDLDNGASVNVAAGTNYTLYFNDGMVFGFPQGATNCVTTAISANCRGIVDVNGIKKPNKLTNCGTGSAATGDTTGSGSANCTSGNLTVGDRFSVRFGGQQVVPNGNAARYVLYN